MWLAACTREGLSLEGAHILAALLTDWFPDCFMYFLPLGPAEPRAGSSFCLLRSHQQRRTVWEDGRSSPFLLILGKCCLGSWEVLGWGREWSTGSLYKTICQVCCRGEQSCLWAERIHDIFRWKYMCSENNVRMGGCVRSWGPARPHLLTKSALRKCALLGFLRGSAIYTFKGEICWELFGWRT